MRRPIKLLHFIGNSVRSSYLSAIADHANRSRFQLTVGTLDSAGVLQSDMAERGLSTFALDCRRAAQYPIAVLRLAKRLRRERVDILQTHLFDASLVGLLAARIAGTPLAILTDHHSHEVVLSRKRLPLWADIIATRWLAHRVVAPSPYMKELLVDSEGVPREKIEVIPYGFDLSRWRASEGARDRIRRELGLEGRIVFGAVGRLYWVKDYPSLLKAFAKVSSAHGDVALAVAGEGPQETELRDLARQLAIEDRVMFVGYRSDVVDFLAAIDVFVHASLAECAVQVVSEAFALGRPVVSTRVGGALELIDEDVNGCLVPTADPHSLAAALEKMLARRRDWRTMGEAGRRRVVQRSVESVLPACEAQYLRWLSELHGASHAA